MITIKDLDISLLQRLSESFGVSGYEFRTIKLVHKHISPFVNNVKSDNTGSFIFEKQGQEESPVVLFAAHVDEVGFMISYIDDSGFLKFLPLGAWCNQTLLGQKVSILTKDKKFLSGAICAVPALLFPSGGGITKKEDMFIDIGCSNAEEVRALGVEVGDPVVPSSKFELVKDGSVAMGKAFDDRIGLFIIMETIRILHQSNITHPNCVVGAATVQEELGIRGAKTAIATIKPNLAFAIEADVDSSIPGIPKSKAHAKMGKGVSILIYDSTMIPNIFLREFVINTAKKVGIPYQLSSIERGGTDAGVFHLYDKGCPSLVLSVPVRNMHTHVGFVSLEDVAQSIRFLVELIQRLDGDTVASFTSFPGSQGLYSE